MNIMAFIPQNYAKHSSRPCT